MIQRCNNPNSQHFDAHGGRGISVCDRWRSFEAFLGDMGERPDGTTLDRFPDNNGNYEPGNCRWATKKEQARNRRDNRLAEYDGETRCLTEWAEIKGVPVEVLRTRVSKLGWDIATALETPVMVTREIDPASGRFQSMK